MKLGLAPPQLKCACFFLQVFHSLLKAHAVEARTVVKQALDILTPAMPARMEDGNVIFRLMLLF